MQARARRHLVAGAIALAACTIGAASDARAGDIVGETDLSYGKPGPSRDPIARSGIAFDLRLSYEGWVAGKTAGHDVSDVFSSGVGAQIDVGLIVKKGLVLYAGWQHSFFGTGDDSPYASLPTSNARGDLYMIGIRGGCSDRNQRVGLELLADLGYRLLRAEGSDHVGGSASISLGELALRPGVGACFRATPGVVIAPTLVLDMGLPTASYSGDVVVNGARHVTDGDLSAGSFMVAVSPGISISGELPF